MAFSDFDLRTAVRRLGLTEETAGDLFPDVPPIEPTAALREWLDEFTPAALSVGSEQARSDLMVVPVLAEAKRRAAGPVNLLPGVTLDVDRERGLNGYCDFVLSRSPVVYYLAGPLVSVVEAKREDIIAGLGQCAASMVALALFNETDGTPVPAVYGCVTSGTNWRFLKLVGTMLHIDRTEYHLHDLPKLLGILVHTVSG